MHSSKQVAKSTVRLFSTSNCHRKDPHNRYVLAMFPYPSGRLHIGHMRVYSISDALAQYYRLNGFKVLHPIGWDSFGLPAENAARSMNVNAGDWTKQNIEVMREQLKQTGVNFDWDREISTCEPDYYKWTQWIFVKLFENDLVHRRFSSVHWDPVDKTVLAAEQIDTNGRSWRSGALAEKRKLKQWAIETPRYAKRLLEGLQALKQDWTEVAAIQANWIGKCDVYRFNLPVYENNKPIDEVLDLRVFDPTELARAEFIVVHSDHPLAEQESNQRVVSSKVAVNFLNGRRLPILFLAPNEHEKMTDEFYLKARVGFAAKSSLDKSIASQLSKFISANVPEQEFKADEILSKAEQSKAGGYQTSRILYDWVVSRQRAWGTPIPMILDSNNDENCRAVPENLLPVLSEQRGQLMSDNGRIETDTLDTFFDSSWYYLRFLDPSNQKVLADPEKIREFMPIDVYVGGIEHADVHLFYARFMSYFLHDIGATSVSEPFRRLLPQGFVCGRTYVESGTGRYVSGLDVEQIEENEWEAKDTGKSVEVVYEKMSKSKANGVDPLSVIKEVGLDLTRLQLLATAAPRSSLNWDESDLKGLRKWIERMDWVVTNYVEQRQNYKHVKTSDLVSMKRESYYKENYNYFVRTVSTCMEVLNLHNTAIARLQGLTNTLRKMDIDEAGRSLELERCVYALVTMLQIFAPNTAQQLWQKLQSCTPINPNVRATSLELSAQKWPQVDNDAEIDFMISALEITCSRITIQRDIIEKMTDDELISMARNDYHKLFFKMLTDRGINTTGIQVVRRPGFHLTLNLDMPESVTVEHIKKVLEEMLSEKVRARKEAKKQRREKERIVF